MPRRIRAERISTTAVSCSLALMGSCHDDDEEEAEALRHGEYPKAYPAV